MKASQTTPVTTPAGGRYRILIVDDVPVQRELVKRYLRGTSFEVVGEAEDGAEAIQMTRQLRPDLVLLDINMPVLSGIDALPQILQAHPGAAVIVFSDYERSEMGPIVAKMGAVAYLEKNMTSPLLPDALVGVISVFQKSGSGYARPPTILLVDDDRENLEALADFFAARLSCDVVQAASAREGLEALKNQKIDLIVSDQNMPEITGIDFLLMAKKMAPGVPRVMLTAYGDSSLQARAELEAEVRGFLSRGASLPQIEEALRRILQQARMENPGQPRRQGPPAA